MKIVIEGSEKNINDLKRYISGFLSARKMKILKFQTTEIVEIKDDLKINELESEILRSNTVIEELNEKIKKLQIPKKRR